MGFLVGQRVRLRHSVEPVMYVVDLLAKGECRTTWINKGVQQIGFFPLETLEHVPPPVKK